MNLGQLLLPRRHWIITAAGTPAIRALCTLLVFLFLLPPGVL
jgi:hypothetical protein